MDTNKEPYTRVYESICGEIIIAQSDIQGGPYTQTLGLSPLRARQIAFEMIRLAQQMEARGVN